MNEPDDIDRTADNLAAASGVTEQNHETLARLDDTQKARLDSILVGRVERLEREGIIHAHTKKGGVHPEYNKGNPSADWSRRR